MYKRVLLIFIIALFLFSGCAAAAGQTTLSIIVKDAGNNNADLEGVTVDLDCSNTGTSAQQITNNLGIAEFSVTITQTYKVTVSKDGYITQIHEGVHIDDTVMSDVFYLARETPLTIIVKDTAGTRVSYAEISVDSVIAGETDTNGILSLPVTRGKSYKFEVTHPSYETFADYLTIGNESSDTIYLIKKEVPPYFFVTDTNGEKIEGASVIISGDVAGITNESGIATLASAYNGKYLVSVTKSGYKTYTAEISITPAQTEYDIVLDLLAYPLTITVTSAAVPIAGAVVYVDEKLAAYSDAGGKAVLAGDYKEGSHTLLVTADAYSPVQQTIIVNADNTNFTVDLSRTTFPVTIYVTAGDNFLANVPVCIDGNMAGVTSDAGIFTASYDIGRTIRVSAVLDGYSCKTVTYTVVNGENNVMVLLSPDVPVTYIAIGALGAIVVLLIVILIVTSLRKRGSSKTKKGKGKGKSSARNNGRSGGRKDFL